MTAAPGSASGALRIRAVLLDVNGTLTDLSALGSRFTDVGLSAGDVPAWFAQTLRDGFALAVAGRAAPFSDVAGAVLSTLLVQAGADAGDGPVAHVLDGFAELPLHPDVAPGLRALRAAGIRVAALTNGAVAPISSVLRRAGVADLVEPVLSAADAPAWKPAPPAYRSAVATLGVPASSVLLTAAHPWDVDGATRSGLAGALVVRGPRPPYPAYFAAPALTATGLDDLAAQLTT